MKYARVFLDPFNGKSYDYEVRDEKEERLLKALEIAAKDECPPNRKDYLCLQGEAEEQDCDICLIRYATSEFRNNK